MEKHYENLKSIEDKLVRLQDIYVEGDIGKVDYETAKERYENIRAELKSKEASSEGNKKLIELYKVATEKFVSLDKQYDNSDLEHRRTIIGLIFQKEPNSFRK